MARARLGVQAEVLLSLGLVMVLAAGVLSAVLVVHHESALRHVVGRALLAEARSDRPLGDRLVAGTEWWTVDREGSVRARDAIAGPIDSTTRALADQVREQGETLIQPGPIWGQIRIGVPLDPHGTVAVAALPAEASRRLRLSGLLVLLGVLVADVVIFTAFGAVLLRRRVVAPLQRLAAAAREVAEGAAGTRVSVEGTAEAVALAESFNEMNEALEARSLALEKAVVELRDRNRELGLAKAELLRTERLAAVGHLAAGVAHEVGNPIAAILAYVDLAGRDPSLADVSREHLESALRQGERVRVILRQLLDFSRPPRAEAEPVDLVPIAKEAIALVRAQRRFERIAFRLEGESSAIALADHSAVAQILVNLLLNAGHAVAGVDEPRVTVTIEPAVLRVRSGEPGGLAPARRSSDAFEIRVLDVGHGIAEGARERIFDPFFTTKDPGEGTGLGLANGVRLAEELGGVLDLVTPPDGYRTAFALRLPRPGAGADSAEIRGGAQEVADPAADCAAEAARAEPDA